jgi:hypothetical protein
VAGWPVHIPPCGKAYQPSKARRSKGDSKGRPEHPPHKHHRGKKNVLEALSNLYEPTFVAENPTGHIT